jgi:hypothetical protein
VVGTGGRATYPQIHRSKRGEFPSNYVEEEEEEVVNPVVSETHDAHGDSTAVDVLDNLMAY